MAVPKRELFKAAEVCDVVQVQPYVLRSWEAEFPGLGRTGGNGGRLYRRADIELALKIKHLVFDEGLTLAGARRRLQEDDAPSNGASAAMVDEILGDRVKDRVRNVRNGLQSLLQLLSRDVQPRELELVPPAAAKRSSRKK